MDPTEVGRFEATVLPHLDAAYTLARYLLHNEDDAKDVVQDAYLRALKYFGGFRGTSAGEGRPWLLAIVRNAGSKPRRTREERPASDLQRDLRPLSTLISAWVSQRARELEIDTTLLATRADIEALLRGAEDARLARGWRAEIVGEPLGRLMAGEAALAFDGRGGLLLEARSHQPL